DAWRRARRDAWGHARRDAASRSTRRPRDAAADGPAARRPRVLARLRAARGSRMDEGSAPNIMPTGPAGMGAPMAMPQRSRLSMTLIRPDGSEGGTHDLRPGENKLGRSFGVVFENDGYLSPVHALLDIRGVQGVVRDLDSLNGVFVKMTQEEELQSGQIIRIGQELLRFEIIPTPEPTADGTELMGSPNPGY